MWILVPSYEPDERLLVLVRDLLAGTDAGVSTGSPTPSASSHPVPALRPTGVLVVDDGSGPAHRAVFDAAARLGAVVVSHEVNHGKGRALRTGAAWLLREAPGHDVVCVDSDGQHRPADVAAVAADVARASGAGERACVLGVRRFVGDVPLRSRVGNRASAALLTLVTGQRVSDTQTGLRGYPAAVLPWLLEVGGDRFEYELSLLLAAPRAGVAILERPIETVYLDHNGSSHFRPLQDSVRVMLPLLAFAASSLLAFVLDAAGVLVLGALTGNLLLAVVGARAVSAGTNFLVNRRLVFGAAHGRRPLASQLLRYAALALGLLAGGYLGIRVLTDAGLPLLVAKVVTDAALFLASFGLQRAVVFAGSGQREDRDEEVRLRRERAQVPGAQAELLPQPGGRDVGNEIVGRVAPTRPEAQHDAARGRQVRR